MDAPKGRYRVIEKDGRLVVIDNGTGAPIPSTIAPPQPGRTGHPVTLQPGPVEPAGPGPIDRAAARLLALAVREWDPQGRAIVAWKWEVNGEERRWDAALDAPRQRRLGRALLALCSVPLVPLLLFFGGAWGAVMGMLLAGPLAGWGWVSLQGLVRETNDPTRAG